MQRGVSTIKKFLCRSGAATKLTVATLAVPLVAMVALSALSTACRKPIPIPPVVRVETVAVSPADMTLKPGGSSRATAIVEPADAADRSVVWSSDDPSVATVSDAGLVTAVAPGTTAVRVTTTDGGKTTHLNVKVLNPDIRVSSVSLNKNIVVIVSGATERVTATVEPDDAADRTVIWTSSDEGIATVDEGLITARTPGRATITATSLDGGKRAHCTVSVYSADPPIDGRTTLLQQATAGAGIDIVLMGDGFSDEAISDGTYADAMFSATDYFFSEEPYLSHREMFNVWSVDVISSGNVFDGSTALGCRLADDGTTVIKGDDSQCMEYALGAISSDRLDNAVIVVMVNSPTWHGTCYMYYPAWYPGVMPPDSDFGEGLSLSYFTVGRNPDELRQILIHESNGHGFPKLGDEYWYDDNDSPDPVEIATLKQSATWGWNKNLDLTSDPSRVKWSVFLVDPRYGREGLGVYEGGYYNGRGVWRATEESILRYNRGGFNAPSREAIYYRMHRLAWGPEWEYNYETFVRWDMGRTDASVAAHTSGRTIGAVNGSEAETAGDAGIGVLRPMPHTPPVIVPRSWRDAYNDK